MNFKTKNKTVVGLTGGILSGKSAALAAFAKAGADVFSCDEAVRELWQSPRVQQQIAAHFGLAQAEREAVAECVFADKAARKWLEELLHPLVLKQLGEWVKKARKKLLVAEVPLLFEADLQDAFDLTVLVYADKKLLPARAKQRGLKRAEYLRRAGAQWEPEKKATLADVVLYNNASVEALGVKVGRLCRAIEKLYAIK